MTSMSAPTPVLMVVPLLMPPLGWAFDLLSSTRRISSLIGAGHPVDAAVSSPVSVIRGSLAASQRSRLACHHVRVRFTPAMPRGTTARQEATEPATADTVTMSMSGTLGEPGDSRGNPASAIMIFSGTGRAGCSYEVPTPG